MMATHTNSKSPMDHLPRFSLSNFNVTLPVEADGRVDEGIFYYRFLDHCPTPGGSNKQLT
jgi:hypothetical protein